MPLKSLATDGTEVVSVIQTAPVLHSLISTVSYTHLKGWIDSEGDIAYVKLLWQTKENGDVGDPVMGVANSETDHTNIVDLKNGLIYCRVAPNTTGGSGLIAAYNKNNQIIWSWHVWVTDYRPSDTGNETVLEPVNYM